MILVTGATGHVGRAVVSRLASLGHDVVAMVRDVQAASRRAPRGELQREPVVGQLIERHALPWRVVRGARIKLQCDVVCAAN